jgi:hypothetical protein
VVCPLYCAHVKSINQQRPLSSPLKYHPGYPDKPFESLEEARLWVVGFQRWYNDEHRHSGLKFVTPGQRHRGEDIAILEQRRQLYEAAKNLFPGRWSGKTRNWEPVKTVYLNPGKPIKKEIELKQVNG